MTLEFIKLMVNPSLHKGTGGLGVVHGGLIGRITAGLFSSFQFIVVGVFGEKPEPAIAVDSISISPCGGKNRPREPLLS